MPLSFRAKLVLSLPFQTPARWNLAVSLDAE